MKLLFIHPFLAFKLNNVKVVDNRVKLAHPSTIVPLNHTSKYHINELFQDFLNQHHVPCPLNDHSSILSHV